MSRIALLLLGLAAALPAAAQGPEPLPFTAEELVRRVAREQGRVDRSLKDYVFDQLEVRTTFGKDGRPGETRRRLFRHLSGDAPGQLTRELVEVDGRPATAEEKRVVEREDRKAREQQAERAAKARSRREAGGEEEELVAARRLSDLIDRFDYALEGEVLQEGRLFYALAFAPRPGLRAETLVDRALSSLAGRVLVDASDYQVAAVEARLVRPVKVTGGLAANVKKATVSYRGARLPGGTWFPCVVDLRLEGRTALVVRLDAAFRSELSGFATFSVETESQVGLSSVESAP